MPLVPGACVGAFEVLERLGAGGMGEVYRARDTRLGRTVALKVLRASGAPGRERLERFKREARAISRLNHPHICALYDIGEVDGEAFLVMEYIDGETLARRLQRGELRIDEVLRYGVEIAEALDAAHRSGIVHRDLKPGNIMLTRSGVKLLDFGLAKIRDVQVDALGDAATMSVDVSEAGIIVGSLPYMAPEQLEGRPVDGRADLFALGAVLYEMTTGTPAFRRSTSASTIAAILSQEPAAPAALRPVTPPLLDRHIRRCVAKAPDDRWQTAADLAAELKYIAETVEGRAGAARVAVRGLRRWRAALVLACIAAATGIALWIRPPDRELRVSSVRPIGAFGASYRQATISPDGGWIAFAAGAEIWIKNLAQGEPLQITSGGPTASHPAWSPKNDQIVFARRRQGLWSVPPLGGTARRLLDFGDNPQFSRDGERLVFDKDGREIWTARADGSDARRVSGVPVPWYSGPLTPSFSPDASSVVYFMSELGPNGDFWIVPAAGGKPFQLTHDGTEGGGPVWTLDGRFIVFSSMRGGSRTLWRVRSNGGDPEPLTAGAGDDIEPALSRDGGTLMYTNVRNQHDVRVLNPETHSERVIVERRRQAIFPRVSPDGSMVAFFGYADFGDVQIFVAPMGGGPVQQLTQGKGSINTMPSWSPDGSSIYYFEQRPGASFRNLPAAGGPTREVRQWQWETHTSPQFSPDGSLIAYLSQAGPGAEHIVDQTIIEDVNSGRQHHRLATPILPSRWSSDGTSVLGQTTGPPVVAICPADGAPCRRLARGQSPMWAAGGSRIYFLRSTGSPVFELWSMTPEGRDERKLFDRMGPFRPIDVTFDVSPAGEVVWSAYREGRFELWQATLRR